MISLLHDPRLVTEDSQKSSLQEVLYAAGEN